MSTESTELARLGAALSNETRSAILCALMSGTAHTHTELGRYLGVAPSSISEHVATLADAGLIAVHAQGRHRYVHIATPTVAALLEQLGVIVSTGPARPTVPSPLIVGRSCYRHLAGRLGVAVHDAFEARSLVASGNGGLVLSEEGQHWFGSRGVPFDPGQLGLRACMDWTERRTHLAGRPAEALLDHALAHGWVRRHRTHPRAIELTSMGRTIFNNDLGIELP